MLRFVLQAGPRVVVSKWAQFKAINNTHVWRDMYKSITLFCHFNQLRKINLFHVSRNYCEPLGMRKFGSTFRFRSPDWRWMRSGTFRWCDTYIVLHNSIRRIINTFTGVTIVHLFFLHEILIVRAKRSITFSIRSRIELIHVSYATAHY